MDIFNEEIMNILKELYKLIIRFFLIFITIFILSNTIVSFGINLLNFFILSSFCLIVAFIISCFFIPIIIYKKDLKFIILILNFLFYFCLIRILFLPAQFGILDGTEISRVFTKSQIQNDNLLIILSFIFSFIILIFKKTNETNFVKNLGIILIIICFGFSIYKTILLFNNNKNIIPLSNYNLLGKNKNIIIIILDSAQGSIFESVMENTELIKKLYGFTLYKNATSPFPMTNFSLPLMLSADESIANNATFPEILNVSNNNNFIKDAEDIGYRSWRIPYTTDTDWLGVPAYSFTSIENKKSIFKYIISGFLRLIPIDTSTEIIGSLYLKYNVFYDSNLLNKISARNFLINLSKNIDVGNFNNSIIVHHSYMVHPIAYWNNKGQVSLNSTGLDSNFYTIADNDKSLIIPEGEYAISILSTFFEKLKLKGVWDDSLIIILGDHGNTSANNYPDLFKNLSHHPSFKGINWRPIGMYNPAIFIKEPDNKKDFSTSNLSLSLLHIRKVINQYLKGEKIDIVNIVKKNKSVVFLSPNNTNENYRTTKNFQKIEINNEANSLEEIFNTKIKINPTVIFEDNIKQYINFDSIKYLFGNWILEKSGAWVKDEPVIISGIYKNINKKDKILSLEMSALSDNKYVQNINIEINGKNIGSLDIKEKKEYKIVVPNKLFYNNKEIYIKIIPNNPISPRDLGIWKGDYLLSTYLYGFTIFDK